MSHETELEHWVYNCEDCVRTREVGEATARTIETLGLHGPEAFQQRLFWPVLQAMQRGVRIDKDARNKMAMTLEDEMVVREDFFRTVLGHPFNPRSPVQMAKLFYEDFGIKPVMSRGKKGAPSHVTCDDDALNVISAREPLTRPLIKAIQEYRTLGVFLSTFVMAPLDVDGRMRTSYNICGTETFRLSSSKNAFGSGANLQNIPKGAEDGESLALPNIRKLFIPDPGYTFFDMDLDRADLQVVVWEADDKELKAALRLGVDFHCFNACSIFRIKGIPAEELVETHPNYKEHRSRIGHKRRQQAKTGVHAVDYGCKERTLAINMGTTVHEADSFIKSWLGAHPGILKWHERTEGALRANRCVTNKFGYRRYYFDRVDGLLPEALAWQPQSTVAIVINKAWVNIYETLPEIQVLLQVHDSLAGQIPTRHLDRLIPALKSASLIPIPYDEPLIIPVGIKLSDRSWGDCA